MPVVLLDGSAVRDFVEDTPAFEAAMEELFRQTDSDGDGRLSRADLRASFERTHLLPSSLGVPVRLPSTQLDSLYDSVFEQFDTDHSGFVDRAEFQCQMRAILLAIADGLGASPLHVALDDLREGLLHDAARHNGASSDP